MEAVARRVLGKARDFFGGLAFMIHPHHREDTDDRHRCKDGCEQGIALTDLYNSENDESGEANLSGVEYPTHVM